MTRWRNPAVQTIVEECLAEQGLELVDFDYRTGASSVIRVYIHHPGGVDLEDCRRVSREISRRLDEVDAVPGSYRLDVASPGLDRPLRKEADFRRVAGERVWVDLVEPLAGKQHWEGEVLSSGEGKVRLEVDKLGEFEVPLEKIRMGKIVVQMK